MAKLFDRIGQATATTGTGTLTLGAVITDATNGDLCTFADMGAVAGDGVNYLIIDGNNFEIGSGTLGGTGPGFTLTRTVAKSKIAGTVGTTALTLSGAAKVYCDAVNSLPNIMNFGDVYHYGTGNPGDTNFARLKISHAGGTAGALIATEAGGTGSKGPLTLNGDGTTSLALDTGNGVTLQYSSSSKIFLGAVASITSGGVTSFVTTGSNVQLISSAVFGFTSGVAAGTLDAAIARDAAGVIAQKNSTNAQTFRVYGSDGGANYSRLSMKHLGGTSGATIATEAGGTGTAGDLTLSAGGDVVCTSPLQTNASGIGQSRLDGRGFQLNSSRLLGWSSGWATVSDAYDTALGRNAAGVIEINNGTAGTLADLTLRNIIGTGGFAASLVTKTASYAATANDCVILGDATSGAITITLPTAVGCKGREYSIKKIDSSANAVTVATTSAQTMDGLTTKILGTQYFKITVVSDGANWYNLV